MKNNIPELLSPAGSFEALRAAVENGCDAVYLGGSRFGARASAENFAGDRLWQAIEFCHLRGVRVYLTLNTLYRNDELADVLRFAAEAYRHGIDALITQDLGISAFLTQELPNLPLHASTQMTAHSAADAAFLRDMGFKRVVLARETGLDEINEITSRSGIETEVFIHGALCVSYSGQCLFSSFLGGRSGNRGRCAQPCRQRFELTPDAVTGYLLSAKDIMTLDILKQIVQTGVASLKIEGRMRSPEYVALTTRLYREALDHLADGRVSTDPRIAAKKLAAVFCRGTDFSEGYFRTHSARGMMSLDASGQTGARVGTVAGYDRKTKLCRIHVSEPLVPGDGIEVICAGGSVGTGVNKAVAAGERFTVKLDGAIRLGDPVLRSYNKALMDEIRKTYTKDTRKQQIQACIYARVGQPLALTLTLGCVSVTVYGAVAEPALNRPMTAQELVARLEKTGEALFNIRAEADTDGEFFINIRDINELRRKGLAAFEETYTHSFTREAAELRLPPKTKTHAPHKNKGGTLTVSVMNAAQLEAALQTPVQTIYFETSQVMCDYFRQRPQITADCAARGIRLFAALPRMQVQVQPILDFFDGMVHGYLARHPGQVDALRGTGKEIHADYTFNMMNDLSAAFVRQHAAKVTLSPELSLEQLRRMNRENAEVIVYGRIPLMVTRQCPVGLYHGDKTHPGRHCRCKNAPPRCALQDKTGKSFPLLTDCDNCLCLILNADTTEMCDRIPEFRVLQTDYRLMFTTETGDETRDTITAYLAAWSGKPVSEVPVLDKTGITRGHFYRVVL